MAEPSPSPETAQVTRVERPWKIVVQVAIAVLALAALAWLWNLLYEDGSWAPGLADRLGRDTWVAAILIGLAVLLVAEILLLKPSYRKVLRSVVAAVEFEIQAEPEPRRPEGGAATPGEGLQYLVGCTGCGTVFERRGAELGDAFSCPNCSRAGLLRDRSVHKAAVRTQPCKRCGNPFKAYMDSAECPVCHAVNAA